MRWVILVYKVPGNISHYYCQSLSDLILIISKKRILISTTENDVGHSIFAWTNTVKLIVRYEPNLLIFLQWCTVLIEIAVIHYQVTHVILYIREFISFSKMTWKLIMPPCSWSFYMLSQQSHFKKLSPHCLGYPLLYNKLPQNLMDWNNSCAGFA